MELLENRLKKKVKNDLFKLSILFTLLGKSWQKLMMKVGKPTIILGIIIIAAGVIFHLQGQAIVGPESSFMYSNPEWVSYGQQIIFVGILINVIGVFLKISKKG